GELGQRITAGAGCGIENADRIQLDILLANETSNIAERIPAAIVFTVGDQEQCFLWIVAFLELVQSEVHGVIEGGTAFGWNRQEAVMQFRDVVGEIRGNLRAVGKLNLKILVLFRST